MIPNVEELLVMVLTDNERMILNDNVIKLIHWILTSPKYEIESVSKAKFKDILSLSKGTGAAKIQMPSHIFKINYNENSGAEKKFQMLKFGMNTKHSFHGTKFYNMHTILSYGLQQHHNKTNLFGEGLYFAYELQVSALFSQAVLGWSRSKIGELISSVCLCEYIDDHNYIKIRKENAKNSDIPQSYLLITNNEIVRVRYLLIYGNKKPSLKKQPSSTLEENSIAQPGQSFMWWCRKNPLIVSAFLYVILLVLVGLSNTQVFEYYKNILTNFLKKRFKFE
jgi:poly [ADP-ribose] polymerase 16